MRSRPSSAWQAHWRGHRQRKTYQQRLRYFKANLAAIIKVTTVVGMVLRALPSSLTSPWTWLRWPGSEGGSQPNDVLNAVSFLSDPGLGPNVGSPEAIPQAPAILPEECECCPAPTGLYSQIRAR